MLNLSLLKNPCWCHSRESGNPCCPSMMDSRLTDCVVTPSTLAGEGGDEGRIKSVSSEAHPHLNPLPSMEKKYEAKIRVVTQPLRLSGMTERRKSGIFNNLKLPVYCHSRVSQKLCHNSIFLSSSGLTRRSINSLSSELDPPLSRRMTKLAYFTQYDTVWGALGYDKPNKSKLRHSLCGSGGGVYSFPYSYVGYRTSWGAEETQLTVSVKHKQAHKIKLG